MELNLDGLIGPTHHYGGLSHGNIASTGHKHQVSSPRRAALEGLAKMKLVADLGIPQAVLPPHPRPALSLLRELGFDGTDDEVLQAAAQERPDWVSVAASASSMWTANAATVSPSADTADGRVHLTPANLRSTRHRRMEPEFTTQLLREVFADESRFVVHDPLADREELGDEGAANHMRLCTSHEQSGVEVFVYGRGDVGDQGPQVFPARQSRLASVAVSRQHVLSSDQVVFAQQTPQAIDAGVFHNDVIAVANERWLLCHEMAFVDQANVLAELREKFPELEVVEISNEQLTLSDAVATYLFNSQLLTLPSGGLLLLCPQACQEHPAAQRAVRFIADRLPQIEAVQYVDVRQSMQNGGGPACLRLRVVLTDEELTAMHSAIRLTATLYADLQAWVKRHYRDELSIRDLGDPEILAEVRRAQDELREMLQLQCL